MATTTNGTRRTLAKVGVITGLVIGALFAGLPVVWMLSTSFKSNGEVFQNPPNLITESFSLDAYWKSWATAPSCASSSTATSLRSR